MEEENKSSNKVVVGTIGMSSKLLNIVTIIDDAITTPEKDIDKSLISARQIMGVPVDDASFNKFKNEIKEIKDSLSQLSNPPHEAKQKKKIKNWKSKTPWMRG